MSGLWSHLAMELSAFRLHRVQDMRLDLRCIALPLQAQDGSFPPRL